jgi:hypothetical protein
MSAPADAWAIAMATATDCIATLDYRPTRRARIARAIRRTMGGQK